MRGIPVGVLVEGHTPEQRSHPFRIPHVFVPFDSSCAALSMLLEGIQSQKADIEHALHQSGAVLLRGFEVLTASDFNDVLEAFGYDNFVYNGRGTVKKAIIGRVFTANEKPVHLPIGFHNEMAYQLKTPSKVMFYCDIEPPEGAGGATPIVQGHIVYQRLKKEMPEFLKMVEDKGLTYIRTLCNDPSAKNSWQEVLQASTKEEAEKKAKEGNNRIEWNQNGTASLFMGPRIGTKFCKSNGRKVWFNNIGSTYGLMLTSPPGEHGISFGDGTPLNEEFLAACKRIMEEEKVAFKWHKGDVLIIDNDAVLHAREPSRPPRKILSGLAAN
ncbi:clavaminate synthase-like protein At3g21360 isoform X1 [Selaginella moellendorffii]|uniref:clavaminate synthase-like protein At3g21360 isoform X1 n=1 Tax=Selaginella moellendorffii TaxID=88036 RepID=UPI000D1C9F5A|nr:clavaminate synthase-like protein At3g21360 isoform X1 [Selaginella moellendorffii]|eukprot:XP_024535015.1 clavaminate synthase-like protein At3g21360 isoform X1 [Selaginella moellendorffii]